MSRFWASSRFATTKRKSLRALMITFSIDPNWGFLHTTRMLAPRARATPLTSGVVSYYTQEQSCDVSRLLKWFLCIVYTSNIEPVPDHERKQSVERLTTIAKDRVRQSAKVDAGFWKYPHLHVCCQQPPVWKGEPDWYTCSWQLVVQQSCFSG